MKTLDSRESLFQFYKECDERQWQQYIEALTEPRHVVTKPLYHMSFTKVADGVWSPRDPVSGEAASEAHPIYGEMLPNRISTSTSLEGCWAGIFCYLPKDSSVASEITAYIYEAKPERGCRILTPQVLSEHYLIQDAHLTDEYCLLGKVKMRLVSQITIKNTLSAPESKWVKSSPFNQKRYGNLHYPPFVLLNEEPIKPETTMSTIKLTFSNEALQNQLSLEAATNPLGLLAEGMTTKFSVLLTQLNNLNTGFINTGRPEFKFAMKPRKLRKITDKNNYMQLMNYGVGVPPGFIGPMVPYMGLLIETLNLYKNLRNDITRPVAREIGLILANPDKLRNSTVTPLSRIDFHEKPNEAFAKRVATYYNPKSTRDEIAYSRLFNDNAEFLKAGELVVSIEDMMNRVNNEAMGVLDDVNEISGLTDKLAIRIMQDKETYGINASIANELAVIISKTANCVSFMSTLLVMGEEAVGIIDNLAKKIN